MMKRDLLRAALVFVCVTALVAAALWGATGGLHAHWIRQLMPIVGVDALAMRGYYAGIAPSLDPTFVDVGHYIQALMLVGAPLAGLVSAALALWLRALRRRDERALASALDALIRGETPEIGGSSLLDAKARQLYNAMMGAHLQAEAEREGVKRLVNDISHQLKTPIAALNLHVELLEERDLSEAERHALLVRLKAQSSRISALAQSLVKSARLETGMIEIRPKPHDLTETVRSAVANLMPKAEQKGVAVEAHLGDPLIVPHDPAWTEEAVANALDNAIKYTKVGGQVRIALTMGASYARVDVDDNGHGIAETELGAVFGRFYRGEAAKATGEEGSGLGLAIAREIMRRQGGAITAQRSPLGGARCSLFLRNR